MSFEKVDPPTPTFKSLNLSMPDPFNSIISSKGPSIDNYWVDKMDSFEDNNAESLTAGKKNSAWWKNGALVFLLMPKGSLIFAPILLKKVFGANALDFSSPAFKLLAAKAAVSFGLWIAYKAV